MTRRERATIARIAAGTLAVGMAVEAAPVEAATKSTGRPIDHIEQIRASYLAAIAGPQKLNVPSDDPEVAQNWPNFPNWVNWNNWANGWLNF